MSAHMQWQWVEHKAAVGGPGLHVSHRGFSVGFPTKTTCCRGGYQALLLLTSTWGTQVKVNELS